MREITTHQVPGDQFSQELKIKVIDEPGSGGANHRYEITGINTNNNLSQNDSDIYVDTKRSVILFQNGPVPANGLNGVTQEVLLAITADRLESFQNGLFASDDNAEALIHVLAAIECLQRRTINRISRGVEGKEIK